MNNKKLLIILVVLSAFAFSINRSADAISTIVKSKSDYENILNSLRTLNIMVDNFSEESLQKKFDHIKTLFRDAGEDHYGQNYDSSFNKFRKLKSELIDLLEMLSKKYLDRSKEILDSTRNDSFDILIVYSKKNANFAAYLRKAFDPLYDVKPYDETKFHYLASRERIESYMRNGYKNYHDALTRFNDPDVVMLRKKKSLSPLNQDFLIERYFVIIKYCRQAKQYGIEIHRILNANELGKSMKEFGVSGRALDPIFDYRIPEKYKVDANDNIGLAHSVELKRAEKRRLKQ